MGKRIRNLLLMLYSSFRCQTSAKRQESTGLPVEEWAPAKRASEACKVCKCHGFSRGYLQNTNKANSTRAGIIVAQQKSGKRVFRITPLLRWRVKERQRLLSSIDDYLVDIERSEEVFPKLQKDLLPLYDFAKKQGTILAHFMSPRPK